MATGIAEIKRIFLSRLDVLSHLLDVGEKHFGDLNPLLSERLAPDMFPLGAQIVVVCNMPRGFAQWCAGQPIENIPSELDSIATGRKHIAETRALVEAIAVSDTKLDETKRIGLGPSRYCELPGHQYVADYLMPNLYFHLATTYDILRHKGAPLGKPDFLAFLAPHVRTEG